MEENVNIVIIMCKFKIREELVFERKVNLNVKFKEKRKKKLEEILRFFRKNQVRNSKLYKIFRF